MSEIIKCGSKVQLIGTEIIGIVTGFCGRGLDIVTLQYEVAWFASGERHSVWLESYEIQIYKEIEKKKPGLVNYETSNTPLLTNNQED